MNFGDVLDSRYWFIDPHFVNPIDGGNLNVALEERGVLIVPYLTLWLKVPFEFPKCSTMYKEADEEIAKYSSYRKYLKAKKEQESEEDKNFSRAQCLSI